MPGLVNRGSRQKNQAPRKRYDYMLVPGTGNILSLGNKSISNNTLEAVIFCEQCSGTGKNLSPGNKSLSNNILEALIFCEQCSGTGNIPQQMEA